MICPYCLVANPPGARECLACGAPLSPAAPDEALPIGTRLHEGRFGVGRVLRRSWSGISYRASDRQGNRLSVIREFFPPHAARIEGRVVASSPAYALARAHFGRDAQLLRDLQHPQLLAVRAVWEEGAAYLATEHLDGRTLPATFPAPLPEADALDLARALIESLTVAHEAGLLHRDIRPENVVICGDGRVVLIEWGAGRELLGHDAARDRFAAPEQSLPSAPISPATDIYSLCALLHCVLAGHAPPSPHHRRDGAGLPDLRRFNTALSPRLMRAIARGLALNDTQRPLSLAELRAELLPLPAVAVQAVVAPAEAAPVQVLRPDEDAVCTLSGHDGRVTCLAWSPDGRVVVSGSEDETLRVWPMRVNAVGGAQNYGAAGVMKSRQGRIGSVTFAARGALLSGGEDGSLLMWDWLAGAPMRAWKKHGGRIGALAMARDGAWCASGGSDGCVWVWDARQNWAARLLGEHNHAVTGVAWSPGADFLASSGLDEAVRVRQMSDGSHVRNLTTLDFEVTSLAWSPSGRAIATGSYDRVVRVWHWPGGDEMHTLRGHDAAIGAVAFSPDGRLLASGGYDRVVCLWDAWMGEPRLMLCDHPGSVSALAWSPDGRRLAVAARNSVWIWSLPEV